MNFKNFLPVEDYTLKSPLSIGEVIKRISENIEPLELFRLSFFIKKIIKPYQGEISGNSFEIVRNVSHINSIVPFITGYVSSYLGQTYIKIRMRLSIPVIIVMCIGLVNIGLVCLSVLLTALIQSKEVLRHSFPYGTDVPFMMLMFIWFIMYFAFKLESKKSKKFLSSLLEGQETNNH